MLAEIGFLFVPHPFGLRFIARMVRITVVETAVVAAFERLVALGAADSAGDFLGQLYFLLTRPAD